MSTEGLDPDTVRVHRVPLRVAVAVIVAGPALALSGCSLFSGADSTPAQGVQSSARASALAAQSASAAAASAAAAANASAAASQVPSLRPKPSASGPCDAAKLIVHLGQASGAVHTYLAKPATTGASPVALASSASRATGAKAAGYAAGQLMSGVSVSTGCAATTSLTSVAKQTATYLTTLSKNLSAGKATAANLSAAEALIADVNAQADRAGLAVKDAPVAAGALG